jgi:hypothetical protein
MRKMSVDGIIMGFSENEINNLVQAVPVYRIRSDENIQQTTLFSCHGDRLLLGNRNPLSELRSTFHPIFYGYNLVT